MTNALPADGQVVSIEKFDKFATIARRNLEPNGLARKIKLAWWVRGWRRQFVKVTALSRYLRSQPLYIV
jgi:predicted O-methyltransferase YrrM